MPALAANSHTILVIGATPEHTLKAGFPSRGVVFWTDLIELVVMPVCHPFADVPTHVPHTKRAFTAGELVDFRRLAIYVVVVGRLRERRLSPGILIPTVSQCRPFPPRFGGQSLANPLGIDARVVPGDIDDRMIRPSGFRKCPVALVGRRPVSGGLNEFLVLEVLHFVRCRKPGRIPDAPDFRRHGRVSSFPFGASLPR